MSGTPRFHEICGKDITRLSENRTVAETGGKLFDKILLSEAPVSPGESFTVRVVETGDREFPSLVLGVTEQSPEEWKDGDQTYLWDMENTWCMWTHSGVHWIHGDTVAGHCRRWTERFGRKHHLRDGDVLSVCLCGDKSLTIIYNNAEFTRVFADLPDKPLWVVVGSWLKKIEISNTMPSSLQTQSAKLIRNSIALEENIEELALPLKLKTFVSESSVS